MADREQPAPQRVSAGSKPGAGMPKNRVRRRFMLAGGVVSGAFVLGVWGFYRERDRLAPPARPRDGEDAAVLTGWIKIDPRGTVVVQLPRQEMGQGVSTSLPMLVAEELDADPALLRFEQAPIDPFYANATMFADGAPVRPDDSGWVAALWRTTQYKLGELLGIQATGGSTSVRDAWLTMRQAGAAARSMLVSAAAVRFGVAATECDVSKGTVTHAASGQRASFGELALAAAGLPVPQNSPLKDPSRFRLLGKPQPRLDVPAKVDGSAQFGLDVRLPGMHYAAIAHSPVLGGRLLSLDDALARAIEGVRAVIELPATSTTAAAVAVVARHYWQARKGIRALEVEWQADSGASHDTDEQRKRYIDLLTSGDARAYDSVGDVSAAFDAPTSAVTAEYFVPYLAHATMEPINCTALVTGSGHCEVWVGSQAPTLARWFAASAADIDSEQVTVHTPYLGGGFGRRTEVDVVVQAVTLARQLPDTPIQLIWSREEDFRNDVYRPMAAARFRAAFDAAGNVTGWHNRIVGQSCVGAITERLLPAAASDLMPDKTTVEGAFDLPYRLPNRLVEHVLTKEAVPAGFWRSVGHSYNAFFTESFIDECAHALGKDSFQFRRDLLADAPRHRKVLEVAAAQSRWGAPLPAGHGRGIALAESFHSIVAQVAEVDTTATKLRVKRVTCVVDCGFAIDPEIVAAQMKSGIVFALSAALHGEITVQDSRVQQGNFPDYDMVRLADSPQIDVHIVNSGVQHLGGIGEPGTPPLAPAVGNAVFAATGKRIRSLPLRL